MDSSMKAYGVIIIMIALMVVTKVVTNGFHGHFAKNDAQGPGIFFWVCVIGGVVVPIVWIYWFIFGSG